MQYMRIVLRFKFRCSTEVCSHRDGRALHGNAMEVCSHCDGGALHNPTEALGQRLCVILRGRRIGTRSSQAQALEENQLQGNITVTERA
ncbi:hypothetical protein KP509_32G031300 [Ceratopteris richardii]|uniref:Uncharacterized protein n=1 Tax=Ceratopteris richardii TaxID=49495 RepID=A0A8T2QSJ9_CERRI|nr:hypothetical protein KP509_32G031300 [Ceratopteris richardii]